METLIPDKWLREYLKTSATPKKIAEALSLHGPSVEKLNETKFGPVYLIEVTTNRVDSIGVYGIAREAAAALPRMGIKATLNALPKTKINFVRKVDYLDVKVDFNLCQRFSAVVIRNVQISDSPVWVKERIEAVGLRAINNVVDISNYIMHEIGQPVHTFDYDKIHGAKMILRPSKKGEKIITLDEKSHSLPGNDIIIEDGSGRIIDLAGIMGGLNSAVDKNTKNVLLFVQTYNPVNIRKTSMSLAHKTEASIIFEKGLDTELVTDGMMRGIALFEQITQGESDKQVLDLYPNPTKEKTVTVSLRQIENGLGTTFTKTQISQFLNPLGFEVSWNKSECNLKIPSWRNKDISIPEDILEEIARIYGYHNLPSLLMGGDLPKEIPDSTFALEKKIKSTLIALGGIEVYTNSLVSKEKTDLNSLRLKNPLGREGEHLRNTLRPSLIEALKINNFEKDPFFLFEVANTYLPKKSNLPEEKTILAGIFSKYDFRLAKGIVERLLDNLHISYSTKASDAQFFKASRRLEYFAKGTLLGVFGQLEEGSALYCEFDIQNLKVASKPTGTFTPVAQYPPQIEDITVSFPQKTLIGNVLDEIKSCSLVSKTELKEIYNDRYTFRIWYQHPAKTLTDNEVEKLRTSILKKLGQKFGGVFS
jgi:phenylalanyl-tRNA synthetase beta chain